MQNPMLQHPAFQLTQVESKPMEHVQLNFHELSPLVITQLKFPSPSMVLVLPLAKTSIKT